MIEEILLIMESRGITGKEMGEMIGMTYNAFYYRASGEGDFTITDIEKMCMILGLELRLEDVGGGWDMEAWRERNHPNPRRRRKISKKRNPEESGT